MSVDYRYPSDDASDATSEADRKWFEEHPDRVTRLRALTDGDVQGGQVDAIIAFCPVDRFYTRIAVKCVPGAPARAWLDGVPHGDKDLLPSVLKDLTEVFNDEFLSSCIDALYAFARTGHRLPDFPLRGHA